MNSIDSILIIFTWSVLMLFVGNKFHEMDKRLDKIELRLVELKAITTTMKM